MSTPFGNPQFGPINPKTRQPWGSQSEDKKPSTFWALAQLGGIGIGPVSRTTYDLVNRQTLRGHRMYVTAVGPSIGSPITGTFTSSDYIYFTTRRPLTFDDFDGCGAQQRAINYIVYTASNLIVWDGPMMIGDRLLDLDTSGFGLSLPSAGFEHGTTSIVYGNGSPADPVIPELVLNLPPGPEQLDPRLKLSQKQDSIVIEIKGDALFETNKAEIKAEAEKALAQAASIIRSKSDHSIQILGHTDNVRPRDSRISSEEYNLNLSKQRAWAVAKWMVDRKHIALANTEVEGLGFTKPKAPNAVNGKDNPEGRKRNRRVEIVLIKKSK